MFASRCPEVQEAMTGSVCDEDSAVFFLELLIKVVLQNRCVRTTDCPQCLVIDLLTALVHLSV